MCSAHHYEDGPIPDPSRAILWWEAASLQERRVNQAPTRNIDSINDEECSNMGDTECVRQFFARLEHFNSVFQAS